MSGASQKIRTTSSSQPFASYAADMTLYDIEHICGHTRIHQLAGPRIERNNKRAWLAGRICEQCYFEARSPRRSSTTPIIQTNGQRREPHS